jgi:MFS family permease
VQPRSLFRHRDFLHLWTAETISQIGTQVSLLALPLVAINVLDATTFEVGALTAVEFSPFVLFGLLAGVVVDRLPRRPVLVWSDLGRAIALATLPLAYAVDALTYGQLLVVVFTTGTLTVFFDVAYMSYLPALIDRDQLADGNAKLEISRSAAQIAGPGIAGVLVQVVGAVTAVVADAVSFVVSAIAIRGIRAEEVVERPAEVDDGDAAGRMRRVGREVREGLTYVLGHRYLRAIALCTATSNFFSSMTQAVFLLYAVRELDYSAGLVGLIFVIANVGILIAATTAGRVTAAIGLGRAIWMSIMLGGVGGLLYAIAPRDAAFAWFVAGNLLFAATGTLYNIDQVSLRQAITPHRLQGRMNASMRFMVWGTMPFGSLAGGALGAAIGLRPTLFIAGIGGVTAFLWVYFSPVRTLKHFPEPAVD